eukprot:evm.model.scf_105.11 EVM.evm.TU.scf_105.11   scf_105:102741-108399(+)
MLSAAVAILSTPLGAKVLNQGVGIVVRESWKKVADFYVERYGADSEVIRLGRELEVKLRVIQHPLDMCTQQAARGNQALEGARDVAVAILKEIEQLQDDIVNQQVKEAQGETKEDKSTPLQWAKKLKRLSDKLDSMIPYLNLAISASSLTDMSACSLPNLPRLMWASGVIQIARQKICSEAVDVFNIQQVSLLKSSIPSRRLGWQTEFMDCHLTVELQACLDSKQHPYKYRIRIVEDSGDGNDEDGTSEDDDNGCGKTGSNGLNSEAAPPAMTEACVEFSAADIEEVDWETSQGLGVGDNDLSPALVLTVRRPAASSKGDAKAAARTGSRAGIKYAVQCRFDDEEQAGSFVDAALSGANKEWEALGKLEYLLRLVCIESTQHVCHTSITDTQARQVFGTSGADELGPNPGQVAALPSGAKASVPREEDVCKKLQGLQITNS